MRGRAADEPQMSSFGSGMVMPPEREREIRRYIEESYGESNLPYYGVVEKARGLENPTSAYIIATVAAFVLYHLDRKYDLVCSVFFHYRHPKCRDHDTRQYDRSYREKLHHDFEAYEAPP